MSDIFISYSSQDRDRILPLIQALEKTGWSVFWDRTIPAGKTWRQVIGSEIQACRSVIVVWTDNSVTSEWVHEEAETGKRKRILVPVLLDNVEPPFGFGSIQAANFAAWDGDSSSPTFSRLVADIATILGPAPAAVKEAEERGLLETGALRKAEQARLREQERQRSEEEATRKTEEENRRRTEEERNHIRQEAERRHLEAEVQRRAEQRKESPAPLQKAPERQGASVPERFTRSDRRQLYAGGAVVIVILFAGIISLVSWPDKEPAPLPAPAPAQDRFTLFKAPITGSPQVPALPSLNPAPETAMPSGELGAEKTQKPGVVPPLRVSGCENLTFDLATGTLNGLAPTVSQDEVKRVLPCSTGSTRDGESYNYGGGVFFLNHDFFFYTGRDFVEVRQKFRGNVSLPLLGTDKSIVLSHLGRPQRELGNEAVWLFSRSYGCLRIAFEEGKVMQIGSHYEKCDQVEPLYKSGPDAPRHIKAG